MFAVGLVGTGQECGWVSAVGKPSETQAFLQGNWCHFPLITGRAASWLQLPLLFCYYCLFCFEEAEEESEFALSRPHALRLQVRELGVY